GAVALGVAHRLHGAVALGAAGVERGVQVDEPEALIGQRARHLEVVAEHDRVGARRIPGPAAPAGPDPHAARLTGPSGALGEEGLELVVAVAHALLHAGGDHPVAGLHARVDGVAGESRAPVAEILEAQALDAHDVGVSEELEGLDDELVLAHGVEGAAEPVALAVGAHVLHAPAAAARELPLAQL